MFLHIKVVQCQYNDPEVGLLGAIAISYVGFLNQHNLTETDISRLPTALKPH